MKLSAPSSIGNEPPQHNKGSLAKSSISGSASVLPKLIQTSKFLSGTDPSTTLLLNKYPTARKYASPSDNKIITLLHAYTYRFFEILASSKVPVEFVKELRRHIKREKVGVMPKWWSVKEEAKTQEAFTRFLKNFMKVKIERKHPEEILNDNTKVAIHFVENSIRTYIDNKVKNPVEKNYMKQVFEEKEVRHQNSEIFNKTVANALMINIVNKGPKGKQWKYEPVNGTFFVEKIILIESEPDIYYILYPKSYLKEGYKDIKASAEVPRDLTQKPSEGEILKITLKCFSTMLDKYIIPDHGVVEPIVAALEKLNKIYTNSKIHKLLKGWKKLIEATSETKLPEPCMDPKVCMSCKRAEEPLYPKVSTCTNKCKLLLCTKCVSNPQVNTKTCMVCKAHPTKLCRSQPEKQVEQFVTCTKCGCKIYLGERLELECKHLICKKCLKNVMVEIDRESGMLNDVKCEWCPKAIPYKIMISVDKELTEKLDRRYASKMANY